MFTEIKQYIDLRLEELDLRLEEAKMKSADALAGIISLIITLLVVTILAITVFALAAFAVMGWLNRPDMLGEPWGTVISIGFLLIVILTVVIIGRKVFPKLISRALAKHIGKLTNDIKGNIQSVKDNVRNDVMAAETRLVNSQTFTNIQNLTSGITLTVAAIRKIRQMFK